MTGRRNVFERALALLLALVLVVGLMPNIGIPAASALEVTDKVVDVSTIDTWKAYFPANSTAHAGAVWTDKSVFVDAADFDGVNKLANGTAGAVTMDPDNFLVALSAIASTSQIEGYSTTPTDTMLVLDVSGSMVSSYTVGYTRQQYGNRVSYSEVTGVNTETVEAMVNAANDAIYQLLSLNKHNRVGVVLYSGNTVNGASNTSTGQLLLPLGRYNGIVNGESVEYLSADMAQQTQTIYERRGNSYTSIGQKTYATDIDVSVKNGLRTEANGSVTDNSKDVEGGTYIQNGLFLAWKQFEGRINAGDTVVEEDMIQAGTKRVPIMVLMSDGAPTTATNTYNNIGTSNAGSGTSNHATAGVGFLTQLTASWIRSKMESGYATTPRFYTLGLGAAGTQATGIGVLNPSSVSNNASGYWTELLDPQDGSVTLSLPNTTGNNTHQATITKLDNTQLKKNYVDQYWYAEDADDMIAAFTKIVQEIILQSKYYATLTPNNQHDIEGYITITDQIGEHMEVKKITGIVIGDTLYSGAEMASALSSGVLGTTQRPTELGNEFVWTVQERMDIDDASVAQSLISAAYNAGQLDSTTGSNYIGWYESANGEYLGHWNESHTDEDMPANTKFINKSYVYLGSEGDSDMMHVIVKVSTNIDNGNQMVSFQIPASLIPMVTYTIAIEGQSLSNANNPVLTSNVASKAPMQLLFEVGLLDTVNEATIADIMAAADHSHPNADGSYSFYTNRWGITDLQDPNNPTSHQVATAHFHPSMENEYYRFRETEIIRDSAGNAITSAPVTDSTVKYYYTRQTVDKNGAGVTTVTDHLMELSVKDLQHAKQEDGLWVIPAGAANLPSNEVRMLKGDVTITNTLDYYSYPYGAHDHATDDFNMYAYLGNNGTFKITPATGLRLTKTVTQAVSGAADSFTFTVTLSEAAPNASVTDEAGIVKTDRWSVSGNVITVELRDGETVNITGLPAGATYEIAEAANNYYDVAITPETGTLIYQQLIAVDATNSPKTYGNLIIEKDVLHPFGGNLTDQIFTFTAVIENINQFQADNITVPVGAVKSFDNGDLTISGITIADDASVTIGNIPHGAEYTVTEAGKPGYAQDTAASLNTSGQITGNSSVTAQFINNYTPNSITPAITVGGTKTFTTNTTTDYTFTFLLEEYDPATQTYSFVNSASVSMDASGTKEYTIELNQTYDKVGAHYYRVYEQTQDVSGMIYDGSQGLFTVTVTDDNHDGVLEVTVTSGDNDVEISEDDGKYYVKKDFTNIYSAEATYVDIPIKKSVEEDISNYQIPLNIFQFKLVNKDDDREFYEVTTNVNGDAVIRIPIEEACNKTYELTEVSGNLYGMIYDTAVRQITVKAEDNGNGQLVASATYNNEAITDPIVFTNTYDVTAVAASVSVKKTLTNLLTNLPKAFAAGDYKLEYITANEVYEPVGSNWTAVAFDAEGKATIALLEDCKKVDTFRFVVREVNTNKPGVIYDSAEYHVTVTTSVKADTAEMMADVQITKVGVGAVSGIHFENTYTVTGEATLPISGTKTLQNRALVAGEFKFLLKDKTTGNILQTTSVHADGSYAFEELKYTASDIGKIFTYQVVEEIPADAEKNGVTYSTAAPEFTVKVVDNGVGGIVLQNANNQIITDITDLDFTNSYATSGTTVTLSGEKFITGDRTAWLAGESYTFELVDENGNVITTRTVNQDDTDYGFTLSYSYTDQNHNDLGIHKYAIREVVPADADRRGGMIYDASTYEVTVSVTDLNGKMSAQVMVTKPGVGNVAQDALNFGNVYTIDDEKTLTLSGEKTIKGDRDTLTSADIYTFRLLAEDGTVMEETSNDDTGAYSFKTLTYDKSDIGADIKYTVVEADTTVGGVTKSNVVYTVEVTVSDNGDGKLKLDYTITDGSNNVAADALDFENTYTIDDEKELALSGKKTLTGNKSMAAGDYSFELVETASGRVLQTMDNALGGEYAFEALKYDEDDVGKTFTYTVREKNTGLDDVHYDPTEYTVTVAISDNGDGKIKLDYTITNNTPNDQLNFTNSYSVVDDDQLVLSGTKTITGDRTQLTAVDIYSFELVAENGTVLQTKQNDATGAYSFDALQFNESHVGQTYTYTVREKDSTVPGVTKDSKEYTVVVAVKDQLDGTIALEVNYSNGATASTLDFVNTYTIDDTKTLLLSGEKSITGDRTALTAADVYSFELKAEDGTVLQTRQNQINGAIIFGTLEFTKADIAKSPIRYTVEELATTVGGVTKSNVVYTVEVTLSDNGDGTMGMHYTITDGTNNIANNALDFVNVYMNNDTETLTLSGRKTITGDRTALTTADVYSFVLKAENGTVLQTKQNNANGAFSFDEIIYTKADIVKSPIQYTVEELATTVGGVTKSNVVYTVEVNVSDNGDGTLKLEYTITDGTNTVAADKLDFVNTYTISGSKTLTLSGVKTLENKALNAGDFAFELFNVDANTVEQTVFNTADGSYGFTALTFDKADIGEHNYIVREKNTGIAGVTYSAAQYAVQVTISDNGDGTLGMDYTITGNTAADALDFVNTYTATPATVTISGVKKMDGDRTVLAQQDVYTFELVDKTTGQVIGTAVNDATGAFHFETITYTYTDENNNDLGEHSYIIREVQGSLGGVTYDATEYAAKVTVTDLGGQLKAVVEITNGSASVGENEVIYTNIYAVTSKALVLEGTKQLSGKALADGDYSFSVLENGVEVTTGTNKGNKIVFEPITYAKPGTHSYTVVEKIPADAQKVENAYVKDGVIYDSTIYTVNVTVTDNGDGTMQVDAVYSKPIAFVNTYVAKDVAMSLQVSKTVENKSKETIGPEGFQFTLADEDGKVLQTVLSDTNGKARFHLNYSEAQVGKHTYTISETNTRKAGVTYDKTTYKVVVNVTRDPVSGDLSAVCTVDGKDVASVELAFTNSYEKAITPPTGDDFNIVLVGSIMLLSVTALTVLLLGKKKVFDNK